MRFAYPAMLVLVVLAPVAGFLWTLLKARREKALERITLSVPRSRSSGLQSALIISGLFLCLFAASRPQGGKAQEQYLSRSRNVVVALDISRSMLATDVRPNRLERAKADIADLVASLKDEGDRGALVAFRRNAALQCPLTKDYGHLRDKLYLLTPDFLPRGETDLGAAIKESLRAIELALDEKAKGADWKDDHSAIIIISDGGDLRGQAIENAQLAKKHGVPIFTVGIGDPKKGSTIPAEDGKGVMKYKGEVVRVKLEEAALDAIAKASGGRYVPIATAGTADTTLGAIYRRFMRQVAVKEQNESEAALMDLYQWFLVPGVCLLIAGAALSKGRFRRRSAKMV